MPFQEGLLNVETSENEDELTGAEISCLRLKGQMIYLPEAENILFLCSPRFCCCGVRQKQWAVLGCVPNGHIVHYF